MHKRLISFYFEERVILLANGRLLSEQWEIVNVRNVYRFHVTSFIRDATYENVCETF